MEWLWLTVPVALFLSWLHPRVWPRFDVKAFVGNGSKDTLLRAFHAWRALWRILIGIAIAVLGAWPVRHNITAAEFLLKALLVWETAYWYYDFNPRLNLARNLPYVGEYHVSWNPNAAWLDRKVWYAAWDMVKLPGETTPPAQEDARVVAVAGPLYQKVLRWILLIGTGVALLLAAVAWWAY